MSSARPFAALSLLVLASGLARSQQSPYPEAQPPVASGSPYRELKGAAPEPARAFDPPSGAKVTVERDLAPAASASTGLPSPVVLKRPLLDPVPGADADRDGLSDGAEGELADALRPFFVFDSRENARRPGEPVTLFQVRPHGCAGPRVRCGGASLTVAVTYLDLWRWDGGYGPLSICGDSHIGDNQAVTVTAVSKDDGRTFSIASIEIGNWTWPSKSGPARFLGGTHFWLYFSAGKHHHYFDAAMNGRSSPYSKWRCADSVDGEGDFMLAALGWPAEGPVVRWNNAGEPEAHDPLYFILDLGAYGFAGESAWGTRPFCGGLACSPSNPTSHNADVWDRTPFYIPPR